MTRILASCFFISLCLTAVGGDWPQWRGPSRDSQIAAPPWPKSLDEQHLRQMWRIPLGPGYSGPIVVGDRVFVTETHDESHEVVRALDRHTGEEIWKAEWRGSLSVPFFARENGSWIRSTPASDGDRLFVAGIRDVLVCLDVSTGAEIWRVDFVEQFQAALPGFGTVCSPLIDGDHVYIQAVASLVKLRKSDGQVIWRTAPESGGLVGAGMGASVFSSPVTATLGGKRQIVAQSRTALFGVDTATGETLWSIDVPAFRGMNILTPLVHEEAVLTSSYGGGTFLYDVRKIGEDFSVTQRWKTQKQGYMSSPVLIDGAVYMHLRNRRLTCIDPDDGTTRWTTRPFGTYWSTVVNGAAILALDQNGTLHLIDSSPTEFRIKSSRRVSDEETWAHLAVSGNELFIRELNAITMWSWK